MNFSEHLLAALLAAADFTKKNCLEFCTPETVLFYICDDELFDQAFSDCGGDTDLLARDLYEYITENIEKYDGETDAVQNSLALECVIENSAISASNSGNGVIEIKHFLHGMWHIDDLYAVYFMEKQGVNEADLLSAIADLEDEEEIIDAADIIIDESSEEN